MTYFATLDDFGRASGFYHPDVHGDAIPPDAIEISDELHAAWLQDTARQRWTGEGLEPFDPPPPPLEKAKAAAAARVDRQAEAARAAWLTPGAGQAMEYLSTEAEARRFVASGGAGDYPFLAAELQAKGTGTLAEIAAEVIALADAWTAAGAEIKRLRRSAKMAIEAAETHEAVAAAAAVAWPLPA